MYVDEFVVFHNLILMNLFYWGFKLWNFTVGTWRTKALIAFMSWWGCNKLASELNQLIQSFNNKISDFPINICDIKIHFDYTIRVNFEWSKLLLIDHSISIS